MPPLTTEKPKALAKDAKPGVAAKKNVPDFTPNISEPLDDREDSKTNGVAAKPARSGVRALVMSVILILLLQAAILYGLWRIARATPAANKSVAYAHLWQLWEKMAEDAISAGTPEQAIFFYEKLLAELPESRRKTELQQKLITLYAATQQRPNDRDPAHISASLLQQDLPMVYFIAEQAYERGNYADARRQFYEFLLQVDQDEQHSKLLMQAHLRIQQCALQLLIEQKKWNRQEDLMIVHALELLK
jgi:tetratricopeptide (TPR) repeat protein